MVACIISSLQTFIMGGDRGYESPRLAELFLGVYEC